MRILVVEDDVQLAGALRRTLQQYRPVHVSATIRDARDALRRRRNWVGAVLDISLPDGSGVEFLQELRRLWPNLPVMMLTGHLERDYLNRAQALGAEYVCKPAGRDNLIPFVKRAVIENQDAEALVASYVHEYAERMHLSPRETQLLSLSVRGLSRGAAAQELGTAENTVKAQTRTLLRKTGARTYAALGNKLLREAVDRSCRPLRS